VLFAQTYKPSRCREVVGLWKGGLEKGGKAKVSRMLGVPPKDGEGDGDLFPEWDEYLRMEGEGKAGAVVDVAEVGEGEGEGEEPDGAGREGSGAEAEEGVVEA